MEIKLPEGYEVCSREDATHAVEMDGTLQHILLSCGNRAIKVADSILFPGSWARLGITPVRKAKPKPIEFHVRALLVEDGVEYGTQIIAGDMCYNKIPDDWSGKTFVEVI